MAGFLPQRAPFDRTEGKALDPERFF